MEKGEEIELGVGVTVETTTVVVVDTCADDDGIA